METPVKLIFFIPSHPGALLDCFVTIVCLIPFIFKRGVVHHGRRSAQIPRLRIRNRKVAKKHWKVLIFLSLWKLGWQINAFFDLVRKVDKNIENSCYVLRLWKLGWKINAFVWYVFKICGFAQQKWVTGAQTQRKRTKTNLFYSVPPTGRLDRFVTIVCLFPFILNGEWSLTEGWKCGIGNMEIWEFGNM